jgi:hypothetical protein
MAAALPAQPGAVCLAAPPGLDFSALVAPGAVAACRAGVLRIGSALAIDLRGAAVWSARLPCFSWGSASEAAWDAAWTCWREAPAHGAWAAVARGLAAAQAAIGARDPAALVAAAGTLLGVGPGLTPSGDDALVGLLAALDCTVRSDPSLAPMCEATASWVRGSARRTTAVSRAYLLHAAEGRFGAQWIALAEALATGDPGRAKRATRAALALGASSGADGVGGLLAGLAALHPEPERLTIAPSPMASARRNFAGAPPF